MANKRRKLNRGTLARLFRRMGPLLRPYRNQLTLGGFAILGVALTEVLRPWPLKIVFDGLLMPQDQPDAVTGWLLTTFGDPDRLLAATALSILIIAIIGGVLAYVQAVVIASVGQKVVAQIRFDLYRHIQRLSHSFHDTSSSGDIISRLTGDVRMMRDLLIDSVVFFAAKILVIVTTIAVMLLMDWRLTLVALSIMPFLLLLTTHFGGRIKGAARRQRRKEGKIAVVMTEGLSAINVVKGFAREAYEEERFAKQNNSSAKAGVVATRLTAHMDRLTQVLLALGTCAVVWYGVNRVRGGVITPGDLIVFTAYLSGLYKPIRKMASMTSRVAKASASGERLLEIFDLHPDVVERDDAIVATDLTARIEFEQVCFAYEPDSPVLIDADLSLNPGEVVAVVGPSGSGKSSTAKLLMRFYDTQSGQIRIDGHDIRDFTLDSLRDQISIVLQDSVLFAAPINQNIAYGRLDASEEDIIHAATLAGANDFIRRLPDGYDTIVGERGETLSGGQRQRIAIARALLRNAPILILDEPLTGLDQATAQDLITHLRVVTEGRTTLLIAHDPVSLSLADRVVQLHDGRFDQVTNANLAISTQENIDVAL